ncbi:hypothetical protein BD324DRAFT_635748, partial [Kockovaella imperatae]
MWFQDVNLDGEPQDDDVYPLPMEFSALLPYIPSSTLPPSSSTILIGFRLFHSLSESQEKKDAPRESDWKSEGALLFFRCGMRGRSLQVSSRWFGRLDYWLTGWLTRSLVLPTISLIPHECVPASWLLLWPLSNIQCSRGCLVAKPEIFLNPDSTLDKLWINTVPASKSELTENPDADAQSKRLHDLRALWTDTLDSGIMT